jgi:hypothetical protein
VDHCIGPKGHIGGGHHDVLRHGAKPGAIEAMDHRKFIDLPIKKCFELLLNLKATQDDFAHLQAFCLKEPRVEQDLDGRNRFS